MNYSVLSHLLTSGLGLVLLVLGYVYWRRFHKLEFIGLMIVGIAIGFVGVNAMRLERQMVPPPVPIKSS